MGGARRGSGALSISTPPSSRTSPSSLRTTASAPCGTTPPVAITTACPGVSGPGTGRPASDCPTTVQGPGPQTAQPSMAEVSKEGRAQSATRSSARTSPSQAARTWRTGASGRTASASAARAASHRGSCEGHLGAPACSGRRPHGAALSPAPGQFADRGGRLRGIRASGDRGAEQVGGDRGGRTVHAVRGVPRDIEDHVDVQGHVHAQRRAYCVNPLLHGRGLLRRAGARSRQLLLGVHISQGGCGHRPFHHVQLQQEGADGQARQRPQRGQCRAQGIGAVGRAQRLPVPLRIDGNDCRGCGLRIHAVHGTVDPTLDSVPIAGGSRLGQPGQGLDDDRQGERHVGGDHAHGGRAHRGESGADPRQRPRTRRVLAHEHDRTSQPLERRPDDHHGHVGRHVGKEPVDKAPTPHMGRGLVPAEPAAGPPGEQQQRAPGRPPTRPNLVHTCTIGAYRKGRHE